MNRITSLLADLDIENLLDETKKEIANGTDAQTILKWCQEGMTIVGERFGAGEYFVSDLMMSSMIFKQVNQELVPLMEGVESESLGKVVLGTVEKDIHDIGKDIVFAMLKSNGFDVIDVGVDAKPEVFVKALKESGAKVLALSCLLTTCYDSIKETVEALNEAGLRDKVKVIIGGGPVDESVVKYSGADTYGPDAQFAVTYCKEVLA